MNLSYGLGLRCGVEWQVELLLDLAPSRRTPSSNDAKKTSHKHREGHHELQHHRAEGFKCVVAGGVEEEVGGVGHEVPHEYHALEPVIWKHVKASGRRASATATIEGQVQLEGPAADRHAVGESMPARRGPSPG
jgi:hypothetical protein